VSEAKKKSALTWLRPLFALVLLAYVAYRVPWKDRLILEPPDKGSTAIVKGEIFGDWQADSVRFVVAAGEQPDADWPPELAAELRPGASVELSRASIGAQPSTHHDWQPGMIRVFREVEPAGLWAALGMFLVAALVSITRWWRLLLVAGCRTTWATTLRLTFLGFFFNQVVPAGITGGDVIKAVLVVRENPARRADALVSVIVDRGLGLVTLVGLAACVVLFSDAPFDELRLPVVLTFVAMLAVLLFVMLSWPRRLFNLDRLLARVPQKERLHKLDHALRIYADHPWEMAGAVVLSVLNHGFIAIGIYTLGQAFGDRLGPVEYLGVTAIANTVSSLPIAPAGWGVGEATFGYLFHLLGASATLGVAVSVTYRLLMMALGLVGGLFLLVPSGRTVRQELETEGV